MSGFFFRLLSEDPMIAVVTTGYDLNQSLPYLADLAQARAAHCLLSVNWYLPHQIDQLRERLAWVHANAPNIHITVMAATETDDLACRAEGIDSFWCNHNCLTDESVFMPKPGAEKRFDAVHTARLAPMKRHELAFDIPRLAIISGTYDVEADYVRSLFAGFTDLAWSNYHPDRGVGLVSQSDAAGILQMSRCGLALSELEGAMFATTEYLLSGLPIVSTPSLGGREVFFHPDYVSIVPPDRLAVAAAVARFREVPIDPLMIRARTLRAFRPHRMRLLLRLSALLQRNLFTECDEHLWHPLMQDKMRGWIETAD
jgi:glycosyltransferase involved in cell wall biosynthesis